MTTTAETTARKNASFFYKVKRKDGSTETGTGLYPSREALIARLARNPDYQSIVEVRASGISVAGKKSRPKARSLVAASRLLEACLEIGMDDRDAIDAILDGGEVEDKALEYGLTEVSKDMGSEGIRMSTAMAKHPYIFPPLMVETLRAGEAGGFVKEAAAQVANDLEAEDDQRAKVKKALTYPVVVLIFSALIFIFMMMYIVPKFGDMYDDLSGGTAELPFLTRVVQGAAEQMVWAVPLLGIVLTVFIMWYRRHSRDEKVREVVDPLKLQLPIFGNLFRMLALSKFCRVLASLSDHGVHLTDALLIASGSVGNIVMEKAVLEGRSGRLRGEGLAEPLSKQEVIPKLLIKFLTIGEITGSFGKVLRSAGRMYDREVDNTANNMESLIQPLFMTIIASMVLLIALAVYLPYFSLGDVVSPY